MPAIMGNELLDEKMRNRIDALVERILFVTETKSSFPIDIFSICEQLGFSFARISKEKTREYKGILVVNKFNNVGRFTSRRIIGINPEFNLQETRGVIAHELGHYFLHADRSGNQINFKVVENKNENTPKEQEANYFAAALLVPTFDFKTRIHDPNFEKLEYNEKIRKLSDFYCVKEDCIKRRFDEIS